MSRTRSRHDALLQGMTRRGFVRTLATAGGLTLGMPVRGLWAAKRPSGTPRVAAIITEYRGYSHAWVILGRFLEGYALGFEPYWPRTRVVSMYVDQFHAADLSRPMAAWKNIPVKSSIADALIDAETGKLMVDGVLIIGEHGNYPHNEKGQHMYPRRRFFEETVNAFRKAGETAPVFNDKHIGYAWEDAKWMYDQSRALDFPFMAGSSLPTTWRKPELELSVGVELEEALAIGYGGLEAYGFHALETLQCMTERRKGGETGVKSVTCLEGDAVWQAAEAGRWSRKLLDAALSRAENVKPGRPEDNCQKPEIMLIEYGDGLKASVVHLDGHSANFGFAAKVRNRDESLSTLFWLQEPEFGHFSYLTHNIESMFLTGVPTYPVERTLLTTGVLDAVMTSRFEKHRKIDTPWLAEIRYQPSTQLVRRGSFRV